MRELSSAVIVHIARPGNGEEEDDTVKSYLHGDVHDGKVTTVSKGMYQRDSLLDRHPMQRRRTVFAGVDKCKLI